MMIYVYKFCVTLYDFYFTRLVFLLLLPYRSLFFFFSSSPCEVGLSKLYMCPKIYGRGDMDNYCEY